MLLIADPPVQLTYCTNIHPGNGWDEVFANLRRVAPPLKATLSPTGAFGLGLRLSAREATELLAADRLAAFRSFLHDEGLYVALINAFPYGAFHGTAVKTNVYAPDWRDPARVQYTLDVIRILRRLLPAGLDGGVSTSPLSYKPWIPTPQRQDWTSITHNLVDVCERLVRIRRDDGTLIHLDIEPEPDCLIEDSGETIEFFDRWLRPVGAPRLAQRLGVSPDDALECLREHIRVCYDCCHFSVEFEDAVTALERLRAAGIGIGRVQLSSALKVDLSDNAGVSEAVASRLRPFAESTYLHQAVERHAGSLRRFPDLDQALSTAIGSAGRQWRIHFHVPLFTSEYDALGSTQDDVRAVLEYVRRTGCTSHLEIETYTWDVLPGSLKLDVTESIAREYRWVMDQFRG
jgi:hypothetical protein